jgi:TPR repeat protein
VISDASRGDARRVAAQLEQIRSGFRHLLPSARLDAGRPIVAFAVLGRRALGELLPEYARDASRELPAGLFSSGGERYWIALMIQARGDRPYATIYHEYTHLLLKLNFPWLPLWLNEGFAEFYGASDVAEERIVLGARNEWHRRYLQTHTPIPLGEFLSVDHSSPHYTEKDRQGVFYAQAWATVHYVMMADKGAHRGMLGTYLGHLSSGTDHSQAALLAFGDPQGFAKKIVDYVHEERFFSQTVAARLERPPGEFGVRELTEAEVLARRADFHLQRGQVDAARADVEEAVRLDPGSAAALEARGLLAWQEGNTDDAARDLSEASAHEAAGAVTFFRLGRLLAERAVAAEERSRARESLQRSVALDDGFAPGHAELARLFEGDETTLAEAEAHARRAAEIEPGESGHRVALARILFRLGSAEAQREGEYALMAAGSAEERERVRESLAFLDPSAAAGDQVVFVTDAVGARLDELHGACDAGNADSCLELGETYRSGSEVPADPKAASMMYLRACEAGGAEGCLALAGMHCETPEQTALESPVGWGCYQMGVHLEQGEGVAADAARAAEFYSRACDAAFGAGCGRLGRLHETGSGAEQSPARAADLFSRGCDAGEMWVCAKLGALYQVGTGVPQDLERAVALYRSACEGEDPWGCGLLGNLYESGAGVAKDLGRAASLHEKSCAGGYEPSCARRAALAAQPE